MVEAKNRRGRARRGGGFLYPESLLSRIANHDGERERKKRDEGGLCASSGEERRKSGNGGREVESARSGGGWGGEEEQVTHFQHTTIRSRENNGRKKTMRRREVGGGGKGLGDPAPIELWACAGGRGSMCLQRQSFHLFRSNARFAQLFSS